MGLKPPQGLEMDNMCLRLKRVANAQGPFPAKKKKQTNIQGGIPGAALEPLR